MGDDNKIVWIASSEESQEATLDEWYEQLKENLDDREENGDPVVLWPEVGRFMAKPGTKASTLVYVLEKFKMWLVQN